MPSGKCLDGRPNPAAKNIITGRDRQNLRILRLPVSLLSRPKEAMEIGLALVEELKVIEEQLCIWEDSQPEEFLALLPWWEDRKEYRRQKALGNVPEVTWYEALNFLEEAYPCHLAEDKAWKMYVPPRKYPRRAGGRGSPSE